MKLFITKIQSVFENAVNVVYKILYGRRPLTIFKIPFYYYCIVYTRIINPDGFINIIL